MITWTKVCLYIQSDNLIVVNMYDLYFVKPNGLDSWQIEYIEMYFVTFYIVILFISST